MTLEVEDHRDPVILAKVQHARVTLRAFLDALKDFDDEKAEGFHTVQTLLDSLHAVFVDARLTWQDFWNHFVLIEDPVAWMPEEWFQANPTKKAEG